MKTTSRDNSTPRDSGELRTGTSKGPAKSGRVFPFLLLVILALGVSAQKTNRPPAEWTEKDVTKMLNDSPWGQTQVETDTSQMVFTETKNPDRSMGRTITNTSGDTTLVQGANNQATSVNYHVVFLSAKPIREAIKRRVEMGQKTPNPQLSTQLQGFVDRDFADYIVVAVTFDTKDPRFANAPQQAFAAALTESLKITTYLDRSDGKRLFLRQYVPPSSDGLGAKFVFDRLVDEKPFLSGDVSQVRFYSELSKSVKLDRRFKVGDMSYNGKLEY